MTGRYKDSKRSTRSKYRHIVYHLGTCSNKKTQKLVDLAQILASRRNEASSLVALHFTPFFHSSSSVNMNAPTKANPYANIMVSFVLGLLQF